MSETVLTQEQSAAILKYFEKRVSSEFRIDFFKEFKTDVFAIVTDCRKRCPTCLSIVYPIIPEPKEIIRGDDESSESYMERLEVAGQTLSPCCDACGHGEKCESES